MNKNNINGFIAQVNFLSEKEKKEFINQIKNIEEKKIMLKNSKVMLLQKYLNFETDELTKSKPLKLIINGAEQNRTGSSWKEFMIHCIKYFIKQGDIKKDFAPVSSKSGKQILISNLLIGNQDNKNHKFDEVTPFCYIDTKYNVKSQLQNLITIMQCFCIEQDYKIELSIYWKK